MQASLSGFDTLLLVSGMDVPDARIHQHRNVIAAAKAAGVRKIVYPSIQGVEEGTAFSPVVQSNRQTEADVRVSGFAYAIGRNGIYFEPDVEYIESYKVRGEIANSAGAGKCGYTTRSELAHAYACLLRSDIFNGQTLNLWGTPIPQTELADYLNGAFGVSLSYREMTPEEYVADRVDELGDFIGPIIGVTGRPHQSWSDYFGSLAD